MTDQLNTLQKLRAQHVDDAERAFAKIEQQRRELLHAIETIKQRCDEIDHTIQKQAIEVNRVDSIARRSADEFRRALRAEQAELQDQQLRIEDELTTVNVARDDALKKLQHAQRDQMAIDKKVDARALEATRKRERAQEDARDELTQNRWGKHD